MMANENRFHAELDNFRFHLIDYLVFGAMLVFSASVGVYYAYFSKSKKKQESTDALDEEKAKNDFGSKSMLEYLLGSRKLKSFPVAMSLVASYISGVTVLGTPAEIYNYGTQYWLIIFPIFLMGFVVAYVYLPVFCSLKVNSSYEVCYLIKSTVSKAESFTNFLFSVFGIEIQFARENSCVSALYFGRGKTLEECKY